ncbi:hypothetical protein [Confluentibacter flavum]|uniref:Uncharacterized protein n=1 Tax=Confluentibacter flavum TaxID=1909700 RepID=A0A2N3HMF8_9FLAO|nr:hypothetical protein [Confluentibacter flavum]PKQ46159.1 hypothetical protein CSW08_03040 [Confluentibacter flavum]
MKKSIVLFSLILAFTNCKNKSETNETSEPVETIEGKVSTGLLEVGCYTYTGNNSSITFEITDINKSIIGSLNYHLAEKDANMGTFEGLLIDDVLLGDYTFESEGVSSRREVIFKLTNGQLFEGYGEMDEEGICFANTDHVTFTSTMPLTKTDCTK